MAELAQLSAAGACLTFANYLHDLISRGTSFLFIAGIILVAEGVFAREHHSLLSRLRGAAYWSLLLPATAIIAILFQSLLLRFDVRPLFDARPPARAPLWLVLIVSPFIGAVIGDFFFYWFHRIQHRYLWRFHRVHHSIRELNGLACYHHLSEEAFRSIFAVLPMSLLISWSAPGAFWALVFVNLQSFYIHSSSRIHVGPFGFILADNRYHRIHHSTDPKHFDKNFAAATPLWDVLFGTAYFPKKKEWPQTGLADFAEPDGIVDYVLSPFDRQNA